MGKKVDQREVSRLLEWNQIEAELLPADQQGDIREQKRRMENLIWTRDKLKEERKGR